MKLRSRLLLLVGGTMLPLVLLVAVVGYFLVEHEKEALLTSALDRNRAFMTAVDTEVRVHTTTLRALASVPSLARKDLAAFHDDATRTLGSQPDWRAVILADPDGQQLVNTSVPYGTALPRVLDMASHRKAVETKAVAVGAIARGRLMQGHIVGIRVPLLEGETVIYVLTAALSLDNFMRLLQDQGIPPDSVAGLTDSNGNFIARVPYRPPTEKASPAWLSAVAASREGWYRGVTIEGLDMFTVHKTSDISNWSGGFAMPARLVYGAAYRAGWYICVGGLITLAVALVFALWMGRKIARPMGAIASAARSLTERDASKQAVQASESNIEEINDIEKAMTEAIAAVRERQVLIEREQSALKSADEAKDQFLAMLGHELRNPLAAIQTSIYLLRAHGAQEIGLATDVMDRQAATMTRLVEDLLDISRLVAGKVSLKKEPLDLAAVVEAAVRTWCQTVGASAQRVVMHLDSVKVEADRARIEQVVVNLVGNAHKFSPPGSAIQVSVRREDAQAVIDVADAGSGIAGDMLDKIFDIFVQAHEPADYVTGGLGLGLAIVKRLVEGHDGTVSASSAGIGKGATFSVRLPALVELSQELAGLRMSALADSRHCA
jgi:signal transduction histidine kinase